MVGDMKPKVRAASRVYQPGTEPAAHFAVAMLAIACALVWNALATGRSASLHAGTVAALVALAAMPVLVRQMNAFARRAYDEGNGE